MVVLFASTLFLSSALLFLVEPMFAKMVLPLLGGTPAVWNTCIVFFQATLFAGYLYAHASAAYLSPRRQTLVHVVLMLASFTALPIAVASGWSPPGDASPILWLISLLAVSVGLPFLAVSTSAPLLQLWFSRTSHTAARDPYFLYQASNLGSIAALLAYPVVVEPSLRLAEQSWLWTVGYGALLPLTLACALVSLRSQRPAARMAEESGRSAESIRWPRRLRWLSLALVPSSLMLGVTSYLSTDIAAIPLLWIIPLLIYLLTFVLAFGRRPMVPHGLMVRVWPLVLLPLVLLMVLAAAGPSWLLIPMHVVMFFVAAMVCHGELAIDRPASTRLTEFYLWISLGGALGGVLNAIVAPLVFDAVVEYPLAMVLACLLGPMRAGAERGHRLRRADLLLPVGLAVLTVVAIGLMRIAPIGAGVGSVLMFGVPTVFCFSFARRPVRFGLGVAALLLASLVNPSTFGSALHTERSFFGVHRVRIDPEGKYLALFHGSTMHGRQSLDPARQHEPLTYYARTGPIGQLFGSFPRGGAPREIAVIGLGSGSMACYAERGQRWTFYEIDPAVERIARDSRYFTFLRDSPAEIGVVLGDARLSLAGAPDRRYDVIVLDAFSSDAIPVHLMTREALKLYLSKLAPNGMLAFHISNRYLSLRPVLADLAEDAGLPELSQADLNISEVEAAGGKSASVWVVMARHREALRRLAANRRWTEGVSPSASRVWTDDYSNLLSVFHWR